MADQSIFRMASNLQDDHQQRLGYVVAMMRELSLQTDPQEMVRSYIRRMSKLMPIERSVSLSRRGLSYPEVLITRFSNWKGDINPWRERNRLPLIQGGILADLLYGDEPKLLGDFQVDPLDPGAPYLEGMRSVMALPSYDQGVALNMTLLMRAAPDSFDPETLPERVWMSNLFGRATSNLVLREELQTAYEMVDRELRLVASIQRSLLPQQVPLIQNLHLAASYETSRWAGGDYYDFFPLPDGRCGLLIADVSGHGTPAAVMMAIVHALSHEETPLHAEPAQFLTRINQKLSARYIGDNGTFVTAFYGLYDPRLRRLSYATAGHNPPRLKRCQDGSVHAIDGVGGLPLGLFPERPYSEDTIRLAPGDQVVLYTDGITESFNPSGDMFGTSRLDKAISGCMSNADELIDSVRSALETFTAGKPPEDDQTLLVAKVL